VASCDKACNRGDAEACIEAGRALSQQPEAAREHFRRACDLKIAKRDPKAGEACSMAYLGPGRTMPVPILDALCDVAPTNVACIQALLWEQPGYDVARATKIAVAIDACQGDACYSKALLLDWKAPHYDPDRARRTVAWCAKACDARQLVCTSCIGTLDTTLPVFDRAVAQSIQTTLDGACEGSGTAFPNMPAWAMCWPALNGHTAHAVAPDTAKVLGYAKKSCDANVLSCFALAHCYDSGECGTPADPAAARATYARMCDAMLKMAPATVRDSQEYCRRADGAAK
jgi:TPR repeat protein